MIYRVTQGAEPEHWLAKLVARRNRNIAAVALLNKKGYKAARFELGVAEWRASGLPLAGKA